MPLSEVHNCDCLEFMKKLPDKAFSLAIADPPYGLRMSNVRAIGKKSGSKTLTTYSKKEWDNAVPDKEFFTELFRISENQIIFGANYFTNYLPPFSCCIVWDKRQPEDVSFAMAEIAYTSFKMSSKIVSVSRAYIGNKISNNPAAARRFIKIHPTQKPILLYQWILGKFAKQGDTIFDPMMGSQSSRIAAYLTGYDYVGCEIDNQYFIEGGARFERECKNKDALPDGTILITPSLW